MNRLVKVTDTDGVVEAAFVYDRAGFLVKEMNAADYLSADTDEERTGTYYTYDYEGNVCSIRKALRKEENGRVCYSRGQRKNPFGLYGGVRLLGDRINKICKGKGDKR